MKRGSACCAVDIYCTAALTSLSDSISYITFLFSEWSIVFCRNFWSTRNHGTNFPKFGQTSYGGNVTFNMPMAELYILRSRLHGYVFIWKRNDIVAVSPPVYTETMKRSWKLKHLNKQSKVDRFENATKRKRNDLKTYPCNWGLNWSSCVFEKQTCVEETNFASRD